MLNTATTRSPVSTLSAVPAATSSALQSLIRGGILRGLCYRGGRRQDHLVDKSASWKRIAGVLAMLTAQQNELLTQTGPGTPMCQLFRSYWLPALLAEELPETACPPVTSTLLSQRLPAFRATYARYGLIAEFCAHRAVSLWFGRNAHSGLRCPYHGWKYAVTGQCIEVPS